MTWGSFASNYNLRFSPTRQLFAQHVGHPAQSNNTFMMAMSVGPRSVLRPLAATGRNLLQGFAPRQARSLHLPPPALASKLYHQPRSKTPPSPPSTRRQCAELHTSRARSAKRSRAHNDEEIPDGPPTTDFSRMDMLGQTPAPSTSVDICSSDGFKLNSGVSIYDGNGVMLVGGEAFAWQPWGKDLKLVNAKGQWEVREEAFAVVDLLWPRPGMAYTTHHTLIAAATHRMERHDG